MFTCYLLYGGAVVAHSIPKRRVVGLNTFSGGSFVAMSNRTLRLPNTNGI